MKSRIDLKDISLDESLMYTLQQLTGEKSSAIIEYFYFLAQAIAEDGYEHGEGWRISKTLKTTYKSTPVAYNLRVWSYGDQSSVPMARQSGETLKCVALVKAQHKLLKYRKDTIMSVATESQLLDGGGRTWPEFPKPKTRIPRGFKDKV